MKLYLSDYVFTGNELLQDAAVLVKDNVVLDVGGFKQMRKSYSEAESIDFSGGVLFPGFIDTHTHLELGYLKDKLPKRRGFVEWLKAIMSLKKDKMDNRIIVNNIKKGVEELKKGGVFVVGDISNTLLSVDILKKKMPESVIFYENYSLEKEKACEIKERLGSLRINNKMISLTPHSMYSSHPCLMEYLCSKSPLISIHFLESLGELDFFQGRGELFDFLNGLGLIDEGLDFKNHWDFMEKCGCLKKGTVFVHCVYGEKSDFEKIKELNGTVCLCVRSNDYITGELPNVYSVCESGVNVAIGTDSLSSNIDLNFLSELRFVKDKFSLLDADTIFRWAIVGGANALKLKWGFFKGFKAHPVFIPSSFYNPLENILERRGDKPPEVIIS